jgi:hypothetical protein
VGGGEGESSEEVMLSDGIYRCEEFGGCGGVVEEFFGGGRRLWWLSKGN